MKEHEQRVRDGHLGNVLWDGERATVIDFVTHMSGSDDAIPESMSHPP